MKTALFVLLGWLLAGSAGLAAQSVPYVDARGTASLVSESDSVAPQQPVRVGLRIVLAPGWHTYGKDPGDAGEPPELDWTLPAGIAVGPIAFPPAGKQVEGPLTTYGYTGTLLLPVTLSGAAGALSVGLHARWLACSNICVPEEARFTLALPQGDGGPGPQAAWFAAQGQPSPPSSATGWGEALLLAYLGGLVLNLMPCVFPVLAVKAAGLAALRGAARTEQKLAHAAAYTAGTVLSFCGIGLALLALRSGGEAVGWGFQFAHPAFVVVTAWLLFAVGLNFSGVFEAEIPGLAGTGQGWAGRGGVFGSFATGLLAVLVASPCTAPFMGAALVAALAAPPAASLGIFAMLGLGLASPYVLLASFSPAARLLPRPGRWMLVLREVLAFPMYAAACWLLWVLAQEAGADGVLAASGGACLIGFAVWSLGRLQRATSGRTAWRGLTLAGAAAVLAVGVPLLARLAPTPPAAAGPADATGEAFTPAKLAALRAQGRPVFIDMTAAWCVTCLLNERVALDRAGVRAAFRQAGVALLRGDWTRQDPGLTAFLHAHGSEGVPLYLFYPGGGGAPVQLPQILTEGSVLAALRQTTG